MMTTTAATIATMGKMTIETTESTTNIESNERRDNYEMENSHKQMLIFTNCKEMCNQHQSEVAKWKECIRQRDETNCTNIGKQFSAKS